MGERQCSAGTEATFCLPQWSILKISLTKLRCNRAKPPNPGYIWGLQELLNVFIEGRDRTREPNAIEFDRVSGSIDLGDP